MKTYRYKKQHFSLKPSKRLRAKTHKNGFSINVFYLNLVFPEQSSFIESDMSIDRKVHHVPIELNHSALLLNYKYDQPANKIINCRLD